MTRLSRYLLPTEKQPPADAEAVSHKLLVRAGMIRQLGAGLWTWLPAGWRVHRKAEQIVREEMNAIGGQELLMPVLHPAELWQRSSRYGITELMKLKDRKGADMVLAMTHEENITFHMASIVRSYRDLPQLVYHIQTKERDEARPRASVLRTREFIMKDAYSFDRDREGLDASYELCITAYDRIFDRVGLEWYRVASDVGMMGGIGAHEYMAPAPAGEDEVALAPGYAANVEIASAQPQPVELPPPLAAPELVETPGMTTVAAVAGELGVPGGALLKAYPVITGGELKLVILRGDHRVNDIKLRNALGAEFRPARAEEFEDRIGPAGYIGPVGVDVPILLDEGVAPGGYVTGSNRPDSHLRGVEPGRDFPYERVDIRRVEAGDTADGAPDPRRARDRGRQHLQARHALRRGARRDLPRRVRRRAADLDGLLRDRPCPDRGRRRRAVRRRARHQLAARARAVRRRARRARQGGHRRARARRAALRRAARGRARRRVRRPRHRTRRQVRRRRAARCPAAAHRRKAHPGGRRDRGPAAARAPPAERAARRRRRRGGGPVAQSPLGRRRLTFRRLSGLDRSGPPPPQTVSGQPLRPWTIPNAIGYVRLALIPLFLVLALGSEDGTDALPAVIFAVVGWSDYFDGIAARLTGQYSRLGALLDPLVDRLLVLSGIVVCWHFELLPRWGLALLAARELFVLVLARVGMRYGIDIGVNWLGRAGVWPVMSALFFALAGVEWLAEACLYVGLALVFASAAQYVRDGIRQYRARPSM